MDVRTPIGLILARLDPEQNQRIETPRKRDIQDILNHAERPKATGPNRWHRHPHCYW